MATTEYLFRVLPRPIYYTSPQPSRVVSDPEVIHVQGIRHETLREAYEVLRHRCFDVDKFKLVFAGIRNPYELEVSRYAFFQRGHASVPQELKDLAMTTDFETFVLNTSFHAGPTRGPEAYYTLGGRVPEWLRLVRTERLADDVKALLRDIGIGGDADFPVVNPSHHDDYRCYFTPTTEEIIHERYKWIFDQGFYPRMTLTDMEEAQESGEYGHRLPIEGPVRQVGPSFGLWRQRWVGETLRFAIRPTEPIESLMIDGFVRRDPSVTLCVSLRAGGRLIGSHTVSSAFRWRVSCRLQEDEPVELEVSSAWRDGPTDGDVSQDNMPRPSFQLGRVRFE